MTTATLIDVSQLEHAVLDHRSPIWWGNVLLLLIESTMFVLLYAAYFFLKQNFDTWPPPRVNELPILWEPVPALSMANVIGVLLVLGLAPMLWASHACLKHNLNNVRAGLILADLIGIGVIWLGFHNLWSVHFRWDDNAYASMVWTILGLHLLHVILSTAENTMMTIWVVLKGLDDKHARDVRVGAVYWYWVVGMWIPTYLVIYWVPRIV